MSIYLRKNLTRPGKVTTLILVDACSIYCVEHNLSSEPLEPAVETLRNTRPRTLDEIIASATARADELNAKRDASLEKTRTKEEPQHE